MKTRLATKMLIFACTAVLFTVFSGAARSAGQGGYLGFSLGQADDDFYSETDTAYKLIGGFTSRNLGIEIAFVDLGSYQSGLVDQYGVAFDGVGYLPVSYDFDLFAKLGIFAWTFEIGPFTDDGTDLTYGFGGSFRLNDQVSLRAEWERFTDISGGDVDLLSAGFAYHF